MLELDLDPLQHPGQVADGAGQDLPLDVDGVPDGHGVGEAELCRDRRGQHGGLVDAGDQDHRYAPAQPAEIGGHQPAP